MGGLTNKKYRKYYLATLLAVVFVLLPTHLAQANWFTEWTFEMVFGNVLYLIFSVAGKLIAALATLLNWAIHMPVHPDKGLAVVDKSWAIMRDFANMFFIVALIVMAFATIFNITKYEARTLFPKFLISALLINFSLVLGVLVIDASQILSNTFLVAIGDMANRLGQDLNPSQLLPDQSTVSAAVSTDAVVFGTLSTLVFSIVLIFTFLFSILTALMFVFIRIPILWALLIVSPIAWALNMFPAGQGTYKKWWSLFIGWNMFLPIYLFFLYFGLYFLSNQKNIIQSIASEVSQAKITESIPFSLQLVFFYIMTAIFMIGGTMVAMKASMFSGTGVVQVAKFTRGAVAKRLGMYVPGKGYVSIGAAGQAAGEKWREIQGRPPMGLESARSLMGVKGKTFAQQQEFIAKMGEEIAKIKAQETAGNVIVDDKFKTAAFGESADTPKGAAMRAILYERGMIDPAEFEKDMAKWTQRNPFLAENMVEAGIKGKLRNIPPLQALQMAAGEGRYSKFKTPGATTSRKKMFNFLKDEDKALAQMTVDQYAVAIDLLGGPKTNDAIEFRKAIAKKRPDLAVEYDIKSKKLKDDPRIKAALLFKEIRTKSAKDLSQMADRAWQNQGFQDALKLKIKVLDRSDPAVKAGEVPPESPPGTPPLKKSKAAGGTVFQNTLRKSVGGDYKKLRIARELRPITDFDETLIEAGGEAPTEGAKKEEPKT